MGKSKWFCPTAKPPPDHILKKYFKFFLRLTAMVKNTNKGGAQRPKKWRTRAPLIGNKLCI